MNKISQEPLKLGLFAGCILGVDKLISFDKSQTAYRYFESLCHKHIGYTTHSCSDSPRLLATGFHNYLLIKVFPLFEICSVSMQAYSWGHSVS